MLEERRVSPLAIDLTQLCRRTVTSFYSNLVTRPTGRAIRMGVESQIVELGREQRLCLSILDFSQVRVMDYSCADEIVAKLLLRFAGEDRPAEAYFLARGLEEHHRDAVEAVLERHYLLLVVEEGAGDYVLLGPADALQRRCWQEVARHGYATAAVVAEEIGVSPDAAVAACTGLVLRRVVVPLADGWVGALPALIVA
ncbi:MAG TPA: hypothetical protein VGR27_11515 [Longimicrobiaceae bacterium]|nr:hypothetical protein [Longimicrobiaceae bacterium]